MTNINPTSDVFFKYLLGSESNKDLLLSFINAVLEDSGFQKIISVKIRNPFNIKEFIEDKESIVDVKATDENGRQYDIEAQITGNPHFKARSLYDWVKIYSGQLNESETYGRLKPVICINLLSFILFKQIEQHHSCFLLREKNEPEYVLTDHLNIHFLELPKLTDELQKNKLTRWLLFFKNEGQKEDLMEILIKDDQDIAKAHHVYETFNQDDQLRMVHEARAKYQMDYNTAIETAREKGIYQDKVQTALNMIKKGYSIDEIVDITGLSKDQILSFKKNK